MSYLRYFCLLALSLSIYFRSKSITHFCRAKTMCIFTQKLTKSGTFWKKQSLCSFFIFLCVNICCKSRDVLFTCLHKHAYSWATTILKTIKTGFKNVCERKCQYRCLKCIYKSDILIPTEKWHQIEQSIKSTNWHSISTFQRFFVRKLI